MLNSVFRERERETEGWRSADTKSHTAGLEIV